MIPTQYAIDTHISACAGIRASPRAGLSASTRPSIWVRYDFYFVDPDIQKLSSSESWWWWRVRLSLTQDSSSRWQARVPDRSDRSNGLGDIIWYDISHLDFLEDPGSRAGPFWLYFEIISLEYDLEWLLMPLIKTYFDEFDFLERSLRSEKSFRFILGAVVKRSSMLISDNFSECSNKLVNYSNNSSKIRS